ncbi:MAG TPA: hypothetical protein VEB86_06690 [Chryseosolibacter sp.]|nr:hypothetical protein [Chryseosolibacter sp.]
MIRAAIDDEKVTIQTLKDDLLDHLCCLTEEKMSHGVSFENAVKEGLRELAPQGMIEIEQETILLLNFNKIVIMKKITFVLGATCTVALTTGLILGLMKMPIGHMIFGLAVFAFLLLYLPVDAVRYFRLTKESVIEKIRYVMSTACSILLATGVMAWIMKLPGSQEIIITGLVIFLAGFLPMHLIRLYKTT